MKYLSLFSGIGGLEAMEAEPELFCELDEHCREVLERRFPEVSLHDDISTLDPPSVEVVAGGWPCQDISVAGLEQGLSGERSGLFFEMLRVADEADAHSLVAENVPNLLRMEDGEAFNLVLSALDEAGYEYVAWRTLNARAFGLPHQRRRVFIVASRHREIATALHRPLPSTDVEEGEPSRPPSAAGFYWTAGTHSICYYEGYTPTLKVGSSLSIPSPPALHFDGVVRKATPEEALRLQGFDPDGFEDLAKSHVYRMAGNAVPVPVGRWVFNSLDANPPERLTLAGFGYTCPHGFYEGGVRKAVEHPEPPLARNLSEYVDRTNTDPLSERAASGLLRRLHRSGKACPPDLLNRLIEISGESLEEGLRDPAGYNGRDPSSVKRVEEPETEYSHSPSRELFA